jgi:N-acetylmuramoyl-L-alanine amidase
MKQKVFFFFLFSLLPLISFAGWGYLPSTAFKDIKLQQKEDSLQIVLHTTGWFRYRTFYLRTKKKPDIHYLVVDIWPVYLPKGYKTKFYFKNPQVKFIKVAQYNPRTVRAVIYLDKKVAYQTKRQGSDLILTLSIPDKKRDLEKAKVDQKICIKDLSVRKLAEGVQIVIKTNGKPYYKDFILPAMSSKGLPARLVVDIWPAYLPKGFKYNAKVQHTAIKKIKIAQFNKQTVRLVLTLKQKDILYEISFLDNKLYLTAGIKPSQKTVLKVKNIPISLPQVFGLKIRKVVLDPGHGGKDPGAIGYRGLKEKDVTLKLAKLVKAKLEKRLGCVVILTRTSDRFVSLKDRAKLANKIKADLFVSIHCNACPDHRLHGIETFFLGFTNDKQALEVAMRENATVNRRMSELDQILQELLVHAKIKESAYLAADVQEEIVATLKGRYNPVTDLGVKQAPFYVLIGTKMPAILIETGFIDHPKEGRRLRDPKYLNLLAEGIYKGIANYIKRTEQAYRYVPYRAGKSR